MTPARSDPAKAARIRLDGVTLHRGERRVLDAVSLDLAVPRVGIVGRNGSGKTTLARAICGLAAPDAGTVRINGVDPVSDRRGALEQVGMIFQNPDHQIIFPTVEEELAFGLRQQSHAAPEDEARAVLARFGRADWAGRPVATLSQGQRHLVCLLAIFAMRPAVILLDEPFAGLDIPTTRQLHRLLDGYGGTIVHITHQTDTLAGYDRVVWIEAGRVRAEGPPPEVLAAYRAAMGPEGEADAFADLTG